MAKTVSKQGQKVVVIDAGHGGWDGGCVSNLGIKESDLNLDISKRLKKQLEKEDIKVVLTREKDIALGDSKTEDMKKRAQIIKESSCDVVISIHINKYSKSDRRGVQVFYDDTKIGEKLATFIQGSINTHINSKYCKRDNFRALAGDLYITKCGFVPSIIIECGFISNSEDLKLLQNDDYKNNLTKVVASSISLILNSSGV